MKGVKSQSEARIPNDTYRKKYEEIVWNSSTKKKEKKEGR